MTAQESSHSEIASPKWAVFGNRVLPVLRARRIKPTPRRKHRGNDTLIDPDNADKNPL